MNITKFAARIAHAATAIAVGFVAFAPSAQAQSGNLSLSAGNPSNCTSFSGFSWSNNTLTVSCNSSAPPPPPCDNTTAPTGFTIAMPSTTASTNQTVNVAVSRQGTGCKGAYNITFGSGGFASGGSTPTGWSANPASVVSFLDGEIGPKNIVVSTGTTGGLIGIWLTQGTAVADGSPIGVTGGESITVTAPPPPPPSGNQPPPGCSTTATYNVDAVNGVQYYAGTAFENGSLPPLKAGESIAASFTYAPTNSWMQIAAGQVTNPASGGTADIEVNIDLCPGNFTATANTGCNKRVTYPNTADPIVYGTTNGQAFGVCPLVAGQKYYINVRQVVTDYSKGAQPSCTNNTGCAVRMQPQNLN